jgi:hypothetical protein
VIMTSPLALPRQRYIRVSFQHTSAADGNARH